jgi:hypothetical protein
MTDRREAILVRLFEIAAGLDGIKYAARNDINVGDEQLPAAIILDNDEAVDDNQARRNIPALAHGLMNMTPQTSLLVLEGTINVGTVLNGLRAQFVRAVLSDAVLASLAGAGGGRSSGAVRYLGCALRLQEGRAIIGNLVLHFQISYPFDPNDL